MFASLHYNTANVFMWMLLWTAPIAQTVVMKDRLLTTRQLRHFPAGTCKFSPDGGMKPLTMPCFTIESSFVTKIFLFYSVQAPTTIVFDSWFTI